MGMTDGSSAMDLDRQYTIADWRKWPDDERWELIDGLAYAMSPSPWVEHQDRALEVGRRLADFLEDKPCRAFIAPLDVFLQAADGKAESDKDGDGDIVVQPDVMAVCDPDKIHPDGIYGAPDFVVEVLSDSTANKDFGVKKELYERCGVREYWIVQPETDTVFQYVLDGTIFAPVREYRRGVPVTSSVFEGFTWARK